MFPNSLDIFLWNHRPEIIHKSWLTDLKKNETRFLLHASVKTTVTLLFYTVHYFMLGVDNWNGRIICKNC